MLKRIEIFLIATMAVILSGCFVPEQFDAKVTINSDGSYIFSYDGTLTFALALAAAQKGALREKDEDAFREEGLKLAREPGFKKVDYLGKGRYRVLVEKSGKAGEPYYFLSKESKIFAILPQQDRSISVSAIRPDEKSIQQLKSIGAKIDGTLTVSVAGGVKVIKHNAQSQPSAFGLLGGYKWQIKSPDENPLIVIQPQANAATSISSPSSSAPSSQANASTESAPTVPLKRKTITVVQSGENAPEAMVRVVTSKKLAEGKFEVTAAEGPCRSMSNGKVVFVVESKEAVTNGDLFFQVPLISAEGGFALRLATSVEGGMYEKCRWR